MTDNPAINPEPDIDPGGGGADDPRNDNLGSGFGAHRQDMEADALIEQARVRAAMAAPESAGGGDPGAPGSSGSAAGETPSTASGGRERDTVEVRPLDTGGFGAFENGMLVAGGATEQDAFNAVRLRGGAGAAPAVVAGGILPGGRRPISGADIADLSIVAVAADVAGGLFVESPRQAVGGVVDAGRELLQALDSLATFLNENVIDLSLPSTGVDALDNPLKAAADALPDVDPAKTVTGGLVRGVAQFLAGFGAGGKVLKAAGLAAKVERGGAAATAAVKGAFADAFAFDPDDENLSNLLRDNTELDDPVTAFLAAAPGDGEAEKRFKKALEGLGLGVAAEGLFRAVRVLRARRIAKREQAAASAADASAADPLAQARETFGEVTDADLGLGAADGPLFEVRPASAKAKEGGAGADDAAAKLARAEGEIEAEVGLLIPEDLRAIGTDAAEGGREIFINFARIDSADDVKAVMGQMADAFRKNIRKAARGKQSQAQTAKLADDLGMTVDDLLARRQGQVFNAEEALAARRLWAASAEKLLEMTRRAAAPNAGAVDQFNFRRMMAVHYAVQAEVIGARTEGARALAAWRIPAGGGAIERARAIQQAMEASGGAELSGAFAKRIAKLAENGVTPAALGVAARRGFLAKTMDAVKESYVLGLLWNPATHLVNIGSNTAVAFLRIAERSVAARISAAAGRAAGEGVERGEAMAQAFGMITVLGDAFRLAGRAIRSGDTGASLQKIDLPRPRAISSEAFGIASDTGLGRAVDFIGNVTRGSGRLLGGEDEFFKILGYRGELHAQAVRQAVSEGKSGSAMFERIGQIVANPPEHIRISAADAALYNTFTNKPGNFAGALMKLRNTGDINPVFIVFPYLRTPANLLRFGFERSPIAPLVGQFRAEIAAGGARRDIALAQMATGSAIMAVAADYAYSGFVSGSGPRDPGERQALERQGWQRNSVYIGGRWYNYQRTDPFGMLLGYAADMAELVKSREIDPEDFDELNEVMAGGVLAVSDTVIDKTYFQGVSRVFETMGDPDRFLPGYINRQIASFVPFTSLLGFAKRAADPVFRDFNTPWEAVMARLPVLSERLPPRRDLWGHARRPDEIYGRGFDLLSPVRVTEVKKIPIDAEMTRLGFGVRRIGKKTVIGGVDINMRDFPEAYDDYVRLAGNDLKHPVWNLGAMDFLNAVVSGKHDMSQAYTIGSDGPEGGKAAFIRKTVREYRTLAQAVVLDDPRFAGLKALVRAKQAERAQQRLPAGVPGVAPAAGRGPRLGAR